MGLTYGEHRERGNKSDTETVKNIKSCRHRLEILLTTSLAMNNYVQMSTKKDNLNLAGFFFGLESGCKEMIDQLNTAEDHVRDNHSKEDGRILFDGGMGE